MTTINQEEMHTHTHTPPYDTISPQFIGSILAQSGAQFDQKIPILFQEKRAGFVTARKSLPSAIANDLF